MRMAILVIVLGGVVSTGGCAAGPPPDCVVDPSAVEVAVTGGASPLARRAGAPTDLLSITNRDDVDWTGVEVAVRGVDTSTPGRRQATGRFASPELATVRRGERVEYELRAFVNSRGGRWMSLTMQPTDVDLQFRRGGISCRAHAVVAGVVD